MILLVDQKSFILDHFAVVIVIAILLLFPLFVSLIAIIIITIFFS